MSKEIHNPGKKQKKGKRVVAVSQPQPKPAAQKPGAAIRPPVQPAIRPPARPAAPVAPSATPWSISLEVGLYVLIAVIAAVVRLYALDRFPLQEGEGARAWTAWSYYRRLPIATPATEMPLTIFGAVASFLLLGDGDGTARLLPALAGAATAVVPLALRRDLGRVAALIAAAFLALAPSFVQVSRLMDGGMIVAGGTLGLIGCALAYRREARDIYIYVAAIALGIMFAADHSAGLTAFILGLFAVIAWLRSAQERELPITGLRNGALIFLATAILLGTGFFSNLQGIQSALINPLANWLAGTATGTVAQRAAFYLRVLLAYEPFVLLFASAGLIAGVVGAVQGRRFALPRQSQEDEPDAEADDVQADEAYEAPPTASGDANFDLRSFLIYWSLAALLLHILLGDQSAASLVQIVLPWTLLAAHFIGQTLESMPTAIADKGVWLLALLFILIVLSFVPWLNPTSLFGGRFTSLERRIQSITTIILAGIVILMVVLAVWYAYRLGLQRTLLALGAAAGIALSIYTIHTTWQVNHIERANATEPLLVQRTASDIRLLLDDIIAVSRLQGDDGIAITIDDRLKQPVRWYLRRFINVTATRTGSTTKTPIVIAPAEAKDALSKSLGRDYVNQRYRLSSSWLPQAPLGRWLRWAHVREPIVQPKGDDLYAFYKLPQ